MKADRTHALLPWYANGTLAPDERKTFEQHLETCPPCRDELETVAAMRAEIARHGEAFFGEHPAPEILGALFGIGDEPIGPADEERVRRHLAVCATCSEESRWLTGAESADGASARSRPGSTTASAPWRWSVQPLVARLWPAVAAAALAVLATVFLPGPWRGGGPGLGPVARGSLKPTSRGAMAEVPVRREHAAVVLDIPSELTKSQLPARIEILDARGRAVHREEGLHPVGPAGAVFTLVVPSSALPPGEYMARLYGAPPGDDLPTEFPFRIVVDTP